MREREICPEHDEGESQLGMVVDIIGLKELGHRLVAVKHALDDDGKSDWQEFKREFNHDLEGIGSAFKDITVRNTK